MCRHGSKYDRRTEADHHRFRWPLQLHYDQSGDHEKTGKYETEEGCLSLDGVRPCTRYKEIEVDYLDQNFKRQHGKFVDFTAQIIQHEIDHFEGILI